MEKEKDTSKTVANGGSSSPKEGEPHKSSTKVSGDTAENKKSSPSSSPSNAEKSGSRRHSTRSIKPPKPFSPSVDHLKGNSKIKKGTNPSSDSKKGSPSTAAASHNPNLNDNRGRFVPVLYDLVEDTHKSDPSIICWFADGKSFAMNPDHEDLERRIEEYFSHGKLRSLQRQLHAYGWTMDAATYAHPSFYRGMSQEEMLAIPRKSRMEIEFEEAQQKRMENSKKRKAAIKDDSRSRPVKVIRRHSNGSSKTNDQHGDEFSLDSLPNFAQTIHNMLEEVKNKDIMRWSAGGKAFFVDPNHPGLRDVLEKYFQHKNYLSFHRQLNQYGWTKPQVGDYKGMLFNPAFFRNMSEKNFDLIRRKDARNYIPLSQQLKLSEKTKKEVVKKNARKKILRVPPPPAAAIAMAASTSTVITTTKSSSKRDEKAKNTAPNGTTSPASNEKTAKKKRKDPPPSSPRDERPKKKKTLSWDAQKAQKRLDDYKVLHGLYDSWTLFSIPPQLKSYFKKNMSWRDQAVVDKERVEAAESNTSHLLCKESLPDWLVQDEKEALEELDDMIIRDRRQRQSRQDMWSRSYTIAKGKTLPRSKFNKPTNKWQKVSPGDRIDVYWHDDKQYYTAIVIKNQDGTPYFRLFYEDDGATEWLDLSREDFKLLEKQNCRDAVAPSGPRPQPTSGSVVVEETPRKDNRSLRPEPTPIPENCSHLAPFLRYSWRSVGLGREVGTPAYNKFIRRGDPDAALVTPLEILQDVKSLRTRGFSAQPDTDLLVEDEPNGVNSKLTISLRDLQDEISQDFDKSKKGKHFEETLSTIRRVTDHWQVPSLIGNMQRMETRVATLEEREARVLEKLRRKDLLDVRR